MLKKFGSFINKITGWVAEALSPVSTVVAVASTFVNTAKKMKETYDVGKAFLEGEKKGRSNQAFLLPPPPPVIVPPPDIHILFPSNKDNNRTGNEKILKDIQKWKNNAEDTQNRLILQTKILELLITSETIEKFTDNVGLHASNLDIHFKSLKNTLGILEIVNRQNKGIKAAIGKLNYLIQTLNNQRVLKKGQVTPIENIDLERRRGAISILEQYNAFTRTHELLEVESGKLINSIERQLAQVEELKSYAKGSKSERDVTNWLNKSVVPNLREAKRKTMLLTDSLSDIPKLPVNPKGNEFQKLLTVENNPKGVKSAKRVKKVEVKKTPKRTKSTPIKKQVKRKK